MYEGLTPLLMGIIILLASLISLRFGISVAILEIIFGVVAGNLGLISPEGWMLYLSSFGGIFLTFLAGAET
ncbi:MAG: cation:proton antiporter, partial [Methanobacteriaceae archaeon]|nr:cation:proton antiporter [Methanobacteriaceae archaeon]